jgi:hypothetical protein
MGASLAGPPRWSDAELEHARLEAVDRFRRERLEEPLEEYLRCYDRFADAGSRLLQRTGDLTALLANAAELLVDEDLLIAFRYLAGPPMSEDDLKAVADVSSLAAGRLASDAGDIKRLVETVTAALDPRRFPWIGHGRAPTDAERTVAVSATAALVAAQRVATLRRNEGKARQEEQVRQALVDAGFTEVPRRDVDVLGKAPEPGQFCAEAKLGTRKGDFLVRLHDQRVMPIECKVSNSYLNSIKRLNNDAAAKAEAWRKDFGNTQVVPTAVLSGMYKLANLREAQERGLTIYWAHLLGELTAWVRRAT